MAKILESLGKWQKLNILAAVLILGGTIAFLALSKPSITGFVPSTYAIKDLEVVVLRDQNYFLNFKDDARLKSVFISGKIIGDGDVGVYLESQDKRYLIFTNDEENNGLNEITAFVVKETNADEINLEADFIPEEDIFVPDIPEEDIDTYEEELRAYIRLLEEDEHDAKSRKLFVDYIKNTEGYEFSDKCVETCALFGLEDANYVFHFEIEPGTTLLVDNIIYSIEK